MTLAFGTTLLGVCSDYPVHLIGHHLLAPRGQHGIVTARAIWPAVRLGGLTTIAGLAGLAIAGFPGIRELAVFSAAGVLASLIATRHIVPIALGAGGAAAGSTRALAVGLARGIRAIERRRSLSWGLLATALLLCVLGFAALRFQDDLASWLPMPKALRVEDERVSASLLAMDPGKLVVVAAGDTGAALAANDRVAAALDRAVAAGLLSDYRSLHALTWSPELQARNVAALRAAPQLAPRALAAFEAAGVDGSQLEPFVRGLSSLASPLALEALLASPLAPVASGFVLDAAADRAPPLLLTHLRGVRDPEAIRRAIAAVPEARYFEQRSVLSATYAAFRARAFELLIAGLVAVLGMVLARYRSLRRSLAAVLPAMLASAATLSVLAVLGVQLDLFHVLGVLLVLSMGEDYGVFLVESDSEEDLPATALGIALACASTVASFALLALSDIPALRSLGQVVSIGVLLATVFAPAGLVLLDRGARGRA
jgi:predicted exporter